MGQSGGGGGGNAAIYAGLAGGVGTAATQLMAGDANAAVAGQNAKIATMRAREAARRGEFEADRFRRDTKRTIGAQRASMAGQGVAVDSGTALEIQEQTAEIGELDALEIRNNAAREAFGYKTEAVDARLRGRQERIRGQTGAASTLLTAGTRAAQLGYQQKQFREEQ
jgi:hypothetical protein